MRVIAAKFPDWRRASAALLALQLRLSISPRDAAIAPLGTPGERSEGSQMLLAGRFSESHIRAVAEAVREAGGQVVADVDELWTLPRPQVTAAPEGSNLCATPGQAHRLKRNHERNEKRQPPGH